MGIKPGPKRIAKSTGKPDRRQRDNKQTPGNTPSLKHANHYASQFVSSILRKKNRTNIKRRYIAY